MLNPRMMWRDVGVGLVLGWGEGSVSIEDVVRVGVILELEARVVWEVEVVLEVGTVWDVGVILKLGLALKAGVGRYGLCLRWRSIFRWDCCLSSGGFGVRRDVGDRVG